MEYEIVTTYDNTLVGSPDVVLVGDGPSLTITMNSWSSKFAVCIIYKDTAVNTKIYGCAPFFVEPAGHADMLFCVNHPESCYCLWTPACVDNF